MAVTVWSDVAVAVQSALDAAVTIDGITQANPAVVSYTGIDPTNGDFVLLQVSGMVEVDERVFRVASVDSAANTFQLEGCDSRNYSAFSAGTFEVITFGTSLGTVTGLSSSGGDFSFIDTTTIHSKVQTQIPGVSSPITYTLENNWDPSDAGLIAMQQASSEKAQRAIKFTFANGATTTFYGYIGATGAAGGSAQDKVTTQVTMTAANFPSNYAS